MSTILWAQVLPLLHILLSYAKPAMKAAALSELKALEQAHGSNPVLVMVIQEAEQMVAAA